MNILNDSQIKFNKYKHEVLNVVKHHHIEIQQLKQPKFDRRNGHECFEASRKVERLPQQLKHYG